MDNIIEYILACSTYAFFYIAFEVKCVYYDTRDVMFVAWIGYFLTAIDIGYMPFACLMIYISLIILLVQLDYFYYEYIDGRRDL